MSGNQQDRRFQEAAAWFARRRRAVMTIDEKTAYEIWRASRENAAALDEVERAWALAELAVGDFVHPGETFPATRRPLARTAVLALMCVVSLGVGIVSYAGHNPFWTSLDWVQR